MVVVEYRHKSDYGFDYDNDNDNERSKDFRSGALSAWIAIYTQSLDCQSQHVVHNAVDNLGLSWAHLWIS